MDIFNDKPRVVLCVDNSFHNMTNSSENHHLLKVGKKYNISSVQRFAWHTLVTTNEFPDITFNSICFEEIS